MTEIICVHCGLLKAPLAEPPMGGQLGATIQAKVCQDCWNQWIAQQALLINHYGLQMADPDDRKQLITAMKEFLNLESER